jgi:lysophospholipase L1-like esterase
VRPGTSRIRRLVIRACWIALGACLLAEVALHFVLGNLAIVPIQADPGDGRCVGLAPGGSSSYTGWFLRIPPVEQEANALGYRGPERPEERGPGTVRIAVIGDSFTYGQGVAADVSLPASLETALARSSGCRVEVMNFGVPALNLHDELEQYRRFARRWRPDLVLLVLFHNDLDESVCALTDRPVQLALLTHWYLYRVLYMTISAGDILREDRSPPAERRRKTWALLDELKGATDADGARLGIVVLGDPAHDEPAFAADAAARGVPFDYLDRNPELPRHQIPGEGHLDPEGNRWLAERIAGWLTRERLLETPRCSPTSTRSSPSG